MSLNESSNYSFSEGKTYSFQVNKVTFLPIVVIVLLTGATFFTLYFGFVNIRKFGLAINVVRGAYSDPNEEGEVSHFQALTAALSGTVGLGNIAGVAIAISIGGAGATFWMIMAGLLGMSSKFVECTLGVKYRTIDAKGEVSGGPMYYLSRGLEGKGLAMLGKIFAGFFAVMCIGGSFGGGNMFQVNQAYKQFSNIGLINIDGWLFGVIMAGLVAIVIIGGIKSIANVTDKIVPFMVGVYVLAALIIIGMNIPEIPRAFSEILSGAFAPTAVAGGFVGVLIQGFRRAAFSNEAGVGSASIAHSAVKTDNPASEGIVALLEPFIDTVVVCTMTALVIIITDNHLDPNASDGVALTSQAFAGEIPFFDYILAIAVILFAFSTMITWSYYGLKAWTYLFGGSRAADIAYKVLFCVFVVIGAAATLGSVTDFSDAMIFAMAFPNIIGLIILSPEVRDELRKYIGKIKSGEIVKVK
ncbi:MAG: alanine:cation symporter family protein [Bacteroidia bacterium]|nr:alanine:cation symporter family protein [Bacteroidia bacterium]